MEFTGIVKEISKDYTTNDFNITFTVNEKNVVLAEYDKIKDCKKLKVTAVQFRNKRSLDANAYMWLLLQKMAVVLHSTKDELYIDLIGKKGVFTHIVVKESAVEKMKNQFVLAKDLGTVTVGGSTGHQLQCYFGSSTYDTKEMSSLIDELVSECKNLDIETLPPDELDSLKRMWGV
jgi:hypothetical protein